MLDKSDGADSLIPEMIVVMCNQVLRIATELNSCKSLLFQKWLSAGRHMSVLMTVAARRSKRIPTIGNLSQNEISLYMPVCCRQ